MSIAFQNTVKKMKSKPHSGRKYLQNMYMIKDLYPEYIMYIYNLIRQMTQY